MNEQNSRVLVKVKNENSRVLKQFTIVLSHLARKYMLKYVHQLCKKINLSLKRLHNNVIFLFNKMSLFCFVWEDILTFKLLRLKLISALRVGPILQR